MHPLLVKWTERRLEGRAVQSPVVNVHRIDDQPTVLWTLRRGDNDVRCEARLLPVGIEGRIVWNGRELYALLFASGEELSVCAGEKRAELETKGWTPPPDL